MHMVIIMSVNMVYIFCVGCKTMNGNLLQIRRWKHWEEAIKKENSKQEDGNDLCILLSFSFLKFCYHYFALTFVCSDD